MRHVLVIRLSALGDVALMAPLVADYAAANPEVRFTVAGPPLLEPLFSGIPGVEYLGLKKRQPAVNLYRAMEAVGADTVVDLHRVNRVGWALLLLRARHLLDPHFRIYSLRKGRLSRWLFLHHIVTNPRKSQLTRYDEVFLRAGLTPKETDWAGYARVSHPDGPIGLAPFAQHEGKIWPWEYTEQLALTLAQHGRRVLLFGSGDEASQLEGLASKHEGIDSLAGKHTFAEEIKIIESLAVMVSMDSANMHFASALGVPVVSIWGATHPDFGFYGYNQDPANALCAGLKCQPCSAFGQKRCRYGDRRCMQAVKPEQVVRRVESLLAAQASE